MHSLWHVMILQRFGRHWVVWFARKLRLQSIAWIVTSQLQAGGTASKQLLQGDEKRMCGTHVRHCTKQECELLIGKHAGSTNDPVIPLWAELLSTLQSLQVFLLQYVTSRDE